MTHHLPPYPNKTDDFIDTKIESTEKLERRRQYQREYQRKRRARLKIISLTIPEEHRSQIIQAAKDYSLSLPQFLIQSTLHNLNKTYLVPNPDQVAHLQQLLSLWHTDFQRLIRMSEEDEMIYIIRILQQRVTTLENQIHTMFTKPLSILTPKNDH